MLRRYDATARTRKFFRHLNSIDAVFYDCPEVRKHWKEYFDLLNQDHRQHEWRVKYLELLRSMAATIGFKDALKPEDLDRVYGPKGLFIEKEKQAELAQELLRVLKASGGVSLTDRPKAP